MALNELTLKERMALDPEEKKRRYQQATKAFTEQNFKGGEIKAENYIGGHDSPTAGLTKQNFARATEGYAANNDGTYRYRATRELKIPDQYDQNPIYAAKDRMQYYLIDNPNAFDSPRELKTANDYWGQIYTVMSQNSQQGRAMLEQAKYFSTQYGNPLYNPYQTSTLSKDIKELFGVDSFSAEWVAENYNLLNNLELTAAGKAKAPTSKSTPEQILAYHFSKIVDAEANTQKAEAELAALKQQITDEVAKQKTYGISKSVDEIYEDLKLNGYSTLKSMENDKLKANPYTLTRAVNYNGKDTVLAMIQAAMDKDDSDISGITDFTEYGGRYANEKYVDSQEKHAAEKYSAKMHEFLNQEHARYRQEQEAIATGDTSIQAKYDAREIPRQAMASDGVTVKATDKKEEEPEKPKNWQRLRGSSAANAPEPEKEEAEKKETKKPAQRPIGLNAGIVQPKPIDPIATEAEIQRIQDQLEAVDSDENAMPAEEYEKLETQLETLQGELRAYKAGNPEEFIDRKYSGYRKDPEFAEYAKQGANMESTTGAHEQYSDTYADPHAEHTSMTADEIEMYNYLLAKEGEAAADQYALDMQETINARQGKKVAEAGDDNVMGQLLYNYSTGFVSSLEGVASAFSDEVRPVGAADYARAEMAENNGDVQNLVNDMASSLGNMTPGILIGSVTGGLGGAAYMGVSASGNAYNQAMRSGAMSKQDARNYGLLVGASEAMLSYALSGISKLGGKATGKLINSINKIDNVFLRASAKLGANMVSEGFEEYLQAQIEPLLQNWLLGMDNDFNAFSEDAMYAALMGAITAGVLEGGATYSKANIETRNQRSIGKGIIESNMKDRLLERAKASDNADVREAAEAIEAGTLRATESTLGQLAIEYHDNGGDVSFLSEGAEADVQPTAQGITTDYDSAMALSRAMRGEATESDLELLEENLDIPNHEDTVNEISAAAKELSGVSKRYTAKEEQMQQLKQDIDTAQSKVDDANSALSMHLRGVVRMQNGEVLGREVIAKHHLEAQIEQLTAEAESVTKAGLDPVDQNKKLETLKQQLAESQVKIDELTAGHREITAFQGQVVNAQKSLDAANRNYSVAEMEMDRLYYEYRAASDKFQNRVANAVNTAFGQNAMGMLEQDAKNIQANRIEAQQQAAEAQKKAEDDRLIGEWRAAADAHAARAAYEAEARRKAQPDSEVAEEMLAEWQNMPEAQYRFEYEDAARDENTYQTEQAERREAARIKAENDAREATNQAKKDRNEADIEYSTVDHAVPVGQPANQATETSDKKQATKSKRKKKLLSAQMIIEQASADFEMPARSGIEASFSKTKKGAKAYHNHRSASMRLPQDIGNFAHELGEFLNKKYRFSTKHADMADAMTYKLSNEFFEDYTEDSLKSEAVAEMVYLYMVNPDAAQAFGGRAYDTFMKELSKADKRALNKMQGRVQKYMTQTVDEINRANSSRNIENLDQRTASAKFRDAVHGLVYDFADNFEPAMRLDRQTTKEIGFVTQDKHVEKKLSDFRRGNTIAGHMLSDTLIDHTGAVVGDGFISCLDGLDANGYAQVSQYLADMRALDWLNHTTVQKIDGEEKIVPSPRYVYDPATTSKEAIEQRVNNTPNEVKAAAEKIWDWYRNFEQLWLVNSGRMTQQELENLWKAEPHYVPFKRVIDYENSSSQAINRGLEQMSNQIQKLTGNGSSRDFIEPLTAIMQSVINLTNGTLRNEVGKTIVWQLRNTDLLGNMATITPKSMGIEALFREDKDFIDVENAFANLSKKKPDGTNLYGVVENGHVTWIQINDPLLLELMESPNPGNMASWMSKLAKLTSTANAMATTFNTKFQLRNLKKDISTAWRNSPTGNPLAFIADEAISAAQLLKHVAAPGSSSQEVLEWIAMGGMDDGRFSANISKQSAEKIYDLANPNLFKVFKDKVNETIGLFESATRLNMYKQGKKYALAEGQSAAAARAAGATASRMGTTDFNRRGARMAGFSAVARFGNAIIEGSFQSVRNLVDKTTDVTSNNMKRKWIKVGADFLTRSAVLAMISQFFMNDREKEQFKRMDPSLKYSGMVFPWEDVSGIKGDLLIVPYPNDPVSSILSIGTAVVEGVLTGGVWDEVWGAAEILWDTLNPFGSPIFGPVLDIYKNETWYGSDLVSGSLEKRHPLYQYDEDTSTLARAMSSSIYNISSKVTNGKAEVAWSPIVIDYVLQQYGGAAYGALEGFEAGVRQLIETDGNIGAVAKNQLYRFVDNISSGYHRNMITGSDVSQLYYDGSDLIESVIYEQNQGVVHPDLAYGLTDDEIMQAYTDAKRLKDEYFKEINQNITDLYTQMDELAENPALDDWEKERQRSQLREQVYDYQLAGIAYVDAFKAKYCGDSYSAMTPRAVDSSASKGYAAFNSADLPESFVSQQDNPAIAKLRSFYEQDTSKTSFKPTYPPDFVKNDKVMTAWDDVDSTTKQAMEKAWTTTYIQELTENGFASITDYKKAKEIASDAKSAANKEAKEIYTIKYGFREDED